MSSDTQNPAPDPAARLVDEFARNLFLGAQRVLADEGNLLRLHMFASTIRELFSYTIHHLSPEAEVRACQWFKQEKCTNKLTRRQRIAYAIYGGLDPSFLEEELLLDPDVMCTDLLQAFDELHKFTHVRPDSLVPDPGVIASHGEATNRALTAFLDNILECRKAVANALEEKIHDAVYDAIASEALPEIDELSSHYSIEEYDVEHVDVTAIDSEWVHLTARASLTVGLQWGSNSDVRNDMGAVGEETLPVTAKLKAPVSDPTEIESDEEGPAVVDTSSWWENYYDIEDVPVHDRAGP